ncbi:hypothetical protein [Paractinoplanes atraurantiacus]|uniref:Uncharacterized protein n=1 Tax=Paractinoplanes atraurantiacus TaxID=1036182 RepID=A0A285KJN0_9ACTN|nr:hypothetical protein [Actinoplanes atraurantiacus]SNY71646.1 hypothetical protein SAMN05421748_14072 [Actinoplanes atraurantiacus]
MSVAGAYARALLVVAVVGAGLLGAARWDGSADDERIPATSTWKDPDGYTVVSAVDVGESSIQLWVRDRSADICFVQEEVDAEGRHRADASGSCWDGADADWRSARGMGTVVFAPPRKEGASVVLTSPDGTRLGPFPVREGLVMIQDYWLHEPVSLELQALDAGGTGLRPAGTLHLEAA